MEKLISPFDKEYMRMAMLKHEATFKEQVYELHRIYRIQKILMKSTESSHGNMQYRVSRMRPDVLERPADDDQCNNNIVIDESEIELTLGPPASYVQRMPRKKHGTPTSESGPSFSSSNSTESSQVSRTKHKTNTTSTEDERLMLQNGSKNNNNNNIIDVDLEHELRQQERLKQPPWLYQVLSLNI